MEKKILSRDEFMVRFSLDEATLREWEKAKLLKPVGFNDDKVRLYSEGMGERVEAIRKLAELGYSIEEIQKILKKVGLPQTPDRGRKAKDPEQFLTVGDLAERVGLSPRTIKHWEDKGIIEPDMRSEGGFRLYSAGYVSLCELVRDLQLFGYTLEEIKDISDSVRSFLAIRENLDIFPTEEVTRKLESMLRDIDHLFDKMEQFKKGIKRWGDLLKKTKKEISDLLSRNEKRKTKEIKGK